MAPPARAEAIPPAIAPNINIIARRTGKDVNSHTVLDGIITTIMATIQRINIIGSREGSRNRRRLKANQTGKKFRVGIKRSEERFSRNAETEIYTLSLHDALPIYGDHPKDKHHRQSGG